MRKQIAAANWKMNLTIDKAETLLTDILKENITPTDNGEVIFAVPFPYLQMANEKVKGKERFAGLVGIVTTRGLPFRSVYICMPFTTNLSFRKRRRTWFFWITIIWYCCDGLMFQCVYYLDKFRGH